MTPGLYSREVSGCGSCSSMIALKAPRATREFIAWITRGISTSSMSCSRAPLGTFPRPWDGSGLCWASLSLELHGWSQGLLCQPENRKPVLRWASLGMSVHSEVLDPKGKGRDGDWDLWHGGNLSGGWPLHPQHSWLIFVLSHKFGQWRDKRAHPQQLALLFEWPERTQRLGAINSQRYCHISFFGSESQRQKLGRLTLMCPTPRQQRQHCWPWETPSHRKGHSSAPLNRSQPWRCGIQKYNVI